jgi:hypothetical protein
MMKLYDTYLKSVCYKKIRKRLLETPSRASFPDIKVTGTRLAYGYNTKKR